VSGGIARTGPVSQRDLVRLLKPVIDVAMRPVGTTARDQARAALRRTLVGDYWRTTFVLHNLASRRCRWLNRAGYGPIPQEFLLQLDTDERINAWRARNDKA
jgi:hypothetical protein